MLIDEKTSEVFEGTVDNFKENLLFRNGHLSYLIFFQLLNVCIVLILQLILIK